MKKLRNLYKNIYDIKNINNMYKLLRKSVKNKNEIMMFNDNLNINLTKIKTILKNRKYSFSKYNIFIINEPKYRLIMSSNIYDKIINHLVSYHILMPLEKRLIDQNVATRKNKGTKYALELLEDYINKLMCKSKDFYILKLDVKKYFYNIDHEILKNKLKYVIDDKDALDILFHIIDSTDEEYINEEIKKLKSIAINKIRCNKKISLKEKENKIYEIEKIPYYNKGKGLPIGNMTSQFMAIFYLNDLDHYIKDELKHKYYIRYMDDLIILDTDKNKLLRSKELIKDYLNYEKLTINSKTQVYIL